MKKTISLVCVILTVCTLLSLCSCSGKPKKYSYYDVGVFDTFISVIGYEKNRADFDSVVSFIKSELKRYHEYYDIYNEYEGKINLCTVNNSQTECKVDKEIIDLLLFGKEMYELTDGAVNIAMGSVLSMWHNAREKELAPPELPELSNASLHADIDDLIINEGKQTVFLADPLLKLDVGAIAKGFAVEQIAERLEEMGVDNYILNVGGNVRTIGSHENGDKWSIGIENPNLEDLLETIYVCDLSVVTSGSYQRFYSYDDKTYHHIIDPETLYPADKFISVSVVCPDSALADALSTAFFVMDRERALSLIASLDNVDVMWYDQSTNKHYSQNFTNHINK